MDADDPRRLTPEQSRRFIELAIDKSVLLPKVRVIDLRPWHHRPKVLMATAAVVALAIAILVALHVD